MTIPGTTKIRATSDDIGDFFGFVYRITNLQSGKQYIGRKYFWQKRKPRGGGRKVTSESDWKKYYGAVLNLLQIENYLETPPSREKSFLSTKQVDG